jgi:hypothetical protein
MTTAESPISEANIPGAPRDVRWRTCLGRRWILGMFGILFGCSAVVILVFALLDAGSSPLDDSLLDSGSWTATGKITAVEEVETGWSGVVWRLDYSFEVKRGEILGTSYASERSHSMRVDEQCTVEYVHEKPEINRIEGTQKAFFSPVASGLASVFAILGIIGLHLWLRSALRLRIALREGRLTTAQIIEARLLRFVNPRPVSVHYRFQDNLGMEHIAGHWVGSKSKLGRQLISDEPREYPVIHDEGNPAISRLVHAEDFIRGGQA